MIRGFNFRLLYRVVFLFFCVVFLCFYRGGSSRYDRREVKTEPRKFKKEFTDQNPGDDVYTKEKTEFEKTGKKGIFKM